MTAPLRRYLENPIRADLAAKMVFLAGPRQVGKTTLAKQILAGTAGAYFSWDKTSDRAAIRKAEWPAGRALIVLDELHKLRSWKRWLKGEFDAHRDRLQFLVTGSARLDVYRRGGDSLQGRYHHYRLHPLSHAEIQTPQQTCELIPGSEIAPRDDASADVTAALLRFGGFPEPFLTQSDRSLRRWQKDRVDRFFREDVRDLEVVQDLASMQALAEMVGDRVGSPLSLNSIREDLEVSHRAVTRWIEILDRLYFVFRVRPFTSRRIRGLKKMAKTYLWDSGLVRDRGARFENLVALHLLKLRDYLEDRDGRRVELHYVRDAAGHEVDFLMTSDGQPWFAVEAKVGDQRVDPSLRYFRDRLRIPFAYQVVMDGTRDFVQDGIRCLPAHVFLSGLV